MKKLIVLFVFVAIAINAFSQDVLKGEYFVDTDPGFGNATGFLIANPDSDFTQVITIPHTSFPGPGYHNLFFRTQDSNGNWSQTSRSFVEVSDNSELPEIMKVEYFFDADDGFGNNSFVLLDAASDNTWDFTIPFDELPTQWKSNDTLNIRVQEGAFSSWSHTTFIDSLNFILVGISELEENSGISIFPNPFSDEINLTLKNNGNLRMLMYNDGGQLVLNKDLVNSSKINTQSLSPGVYVIIFYSDRQKLYGTKLIKNQ